MEGCWDTDSDTDLGLRDTRRSRSRRDTGEVGLAKQVIVLSTGTLTLIYLDEHPGLVVGIS